MNSFKKIASPSRSASPAFRGDTFNQRQQAAVQARQAMLDRFRAKPDANDPTLLERQATQVALSEARAIRQGERAALRAEETAKLEAERAEAAAQAARDAEAAALRATEDAARAEALKVEQKAARDARYAARKARNR
jgi:hypothetical protein